MSASMYTRTPRSSQEPSPHIEKLLEAANSASQTVAALHVAFMAFAAYLGVIVWGTKHENLLLISPVRLPVLDVELPLTTFYGFVSWLVVLLHFNLLLQLELLSRKLWNLDRALPTTPVGQQIRDRLFIFPFTHLIAGRSSVRLIGWLLSLVVGLTVIALPLFMLLAAQIRFLPFHDETITWLQRLAVWVDSLILLALWPLIASPNDSAREWWRNVRFRLFDFWFLWLLYWCITGLNWLLRWLCRRWPSLNLSEIDKNAPKTVNEVKGMIVLLASVPVVVLFSIIAVIPGSITLQTYNASPTEIPTDSPQYFEDWLIRHVPNEAWLRIVDEKNHENSQICEPISPFNKLKVIRQRVTLGLTCLAFDSGYFPRNLNLKQARLLSKEMSQSLLSRAIDQDKLVRDAAFKEFNGLNLQNRDLRFANLFGTVLPKTDLQGALLHATDLRSAELEGARFNGAQLQGAVLPQANLQSADFRDANTQGADLRNVNLQAADLRSAKMQNSDLRGANLHGVDLRGAKLQYAKLSGAKLQGATFHNAELQAAEVQRADLQGADFSFSKLQGADMKWSDLHATTLPRDQIMMINWSEANLDYIFIVNYTVSDWTDHQQRDMDATLKKLLDESEFANFQLRLMSSIKGLPVGNSISQKDCYSDNSSLLECKYRESTLDIYRTSILYPQLVALACDDTAIAEGIAIRGYDKLPNAPVPDINLAKALVIELDKPKPCKGLVGLSEQSRQKLRIVKFEDEQDQQRKLLNKREKLN